MGKPQHAARTGCRRGTALRHAAAVTLALAALGGCSTSTSPSPSAAQSSLPASSNPTSPASGSSSAAPVTVWQPKPGLTWQWQLSGKVDVSVDAQVYDIDGAENGAAIVATLHAAGRKVICYVNAGAYESFRADANRYPAPILGR